MSFSVFGLILVILILIPSIIFGVKYSPIDTPANIDKTSNVFKIMEKIGQIGCIIVLLFLDVKVEASIKYYSFLVIIILLYVLYYYCWIRYVLNGRQYVFLGSKLLFIPIPLATIPSLIFFITGIFNNSIILVLLSIIFAISHIKISYDNYLEAKKEKSLN